MKPLDCCSVLFILFFVCSCAARNLSSGDQVTHNHPAAESRPAKHREVIPGYKNQPNYVPGEILVKFKDDTDEEIIIKIQKELTLKIIRRFDRPGLYLMKITDGSALEKIIECLKEYREVIYAEPNYIKHLNR